MVVIIEVDVVELDMDIELDCEKVLVDCELDASVAAGGDPEPELEYGTVTKVVDNIVVVTETVDTGTPGGAMLVAAGESPGRAPAAVLSPSSDAIADHSPSQNSSKTLRSSLQLSWLCFIFHRALIASASSSTGSQRNNIMWSEQQMYLFGTEAHKREEERTTTERRIHAQERRRMQVQAHVTSEARRERSRMKRIAHDIRQHESC